MLAINGKVIEQTTSIEFLDILLDEHFSWENRISIVKNKVSKNIGIFYKVKNIVTKSGLKIYLSFIVT